MQAQQQLDPLFQPLGKREEQELFMRPSRSQFQETLHKLVRNKLAMLGFGLIVLLVSMAIIGPSLTPYSYSDQSLLEVNQPISAEHWFGTDDMGRDVFARTWYGARISLTIGFVAALVDLVIGVTVGGIAGYMAGRGRRGNLIDGFLMRLVEILYGLPYLLVVILLMVIMEPLLFPLATRQ